MKTTRFVYHKKSKNSIWPFLFQIMGRTIFNAKQVLPTQERIAQFESYLLQGDVLADQVAKDLFMSELGTKNGMRLLNKAIEVGLDDADNAPSSLHQLLNEVTTTPTWLDRELLEKGATISRRLGGHAMAVLGDLALLGGYANTDISKPLVFTGALKGDSTFDRVSETSQFWVDVTRKQALQIGAKGFKSAIRVRLMHAMVRQRLLQHPKWDSISWGYPINEADSLATNVGFSMAMIYGCKLLGFYLPNKDIEAVLHLWRYIGYLMGNDTNWLPKTTEEGLQCLLLIHLSNPNNPDEESITLAQDYLKSFKPKSSIRDWKQYANEWFYFYKHRAYAQYLIPFDIYSRLKLPSSNLTWLLVPMVEAPQIFIKDRLRLVIPSLRKKMEQDGALFQEQVIKDRMGEKQAKYVPVEQLRK